MEASETPDPAPKRGAESSAGARPAVGGDGETPTGQEDQTGDHKPGTADQLKLIGGLIALFLGLLALSGVLAMSKWLDVNARQFTQLATTVIGVVASIVAAYFGVKIGTDGTQKALEAQREEAARSQIFAAHLPPEVAKEALRRAFPNRAGGPDEQDSAPEKSKRQRDRGE